MLGKPLKIKILKRLFKRFRIDPLLFAYNQIGILNWENDDLSGENFFVKNILGKELHKNKELIFFDIGANVGRYSENLLNAFNEAKIYAFEPLPSCFTKLQSLKEKHLTRLILNNFCVSDKEGEHLINTYFNDPKSEHASLYSDVLTTIHKSNHIQHIPVSAITVDKYCEDNQITAIDLLKIDTEGHEFKVLKGAKKMIDGNKISFIQFEFNEMNVISRTYFKDFYDLLNQGYYIFRLNSNSMIHIKSYDPFLEVFKFQNFIAINKTLKQNLFEL